ncbi:metallophosphoesterase family protein [bacterium]|nr:metallophosphoesterase family protein [bacterium]
MRILLISDTHGSIPFDLQELKCDVLMHAGDVGPLSLMNSFYEFDSWNAVLGNTDFDLVETLPPTLFSREYGPSIFMVHNLAAPHRIIAENSVDIEKLKPEMVFYGHTHLPDITEKNNIIYVNPGSLGKPGLTNIQSYAIVTTESDRVQRVEIYDVKNHTVVLSWMKDSKKGVN